MGQSLGRARRRRSLPRCLEPGRARGGRHEHESLHPEDVFGPADVAREVNARYGARLKQPVDGRAASVTLRRLAATGEIHLVRKGTAHHEAQYSRARPAG